MPIDGHAYLVSQGWEGKGSGLRQGAISRPITITQKKSLSGIGKDRDEAFPFWDHVFEAAAINIQVKLDDSDDSDDESTEVVTLQRTKTGIISNRRPKTGTPALSGSATPITDGSGGVTPRYSVMAAAKQEAARRTLYSMFFRGPILGSDFDELPVAESSQAAREREAAQVVKVTEETTTVRVEKKKSKKRKERDGEGRGEAAEDPEKRKKKKRKAKTSEEQDEEKREKKRRKREAAGATEEAARGAPGELTPDPTPKSSSADVASVDAEDRKRSKEEKRARKEDKRKRKAEKEKNKERKESKAEKEGKADKSSRSDKSERRKKDS